MRQRLVSAAVLVPVVVAIFVLGDPWLTIGIAALAALAAYEAARLLRLAGYDAEPWLAVIIATVAVPVTRMTVGTFQLYQWLFTFAPAVVIVTAVVALRLPPNRGAISWVGTMSAGLYASLLAFAAALLSFQTESFGQLGHYFDAGRVLVLVLVLTVWSLDSFAYLTGRYFGRGRFFPHLSPNKTLTGSIGGTLAAVVVCSVLMLGAGQSLVSGVVLGLVIAVAAQAGDLTESMLKRAAGVKDSGGLIPGHGGILDRVDSFLFAAPAMVMALVWVQSLLAYGSG